MTAHLEPSASGGKFAMLAGEGQLTLTAGAAGLSSPVTLSGSGTLTVGAALSSPVSLGGSGTLSIAAGVAGRGTRILVTALSDATLRALQTEEQLDEQVIRRIRRIVDWVISEQIAPLESQVERLAALVTEAQVAGVLDATVLDDEAHAPAANDEAEPLETVALDELYDLQMLTTRWMIQCLESTPRSTLIDKYMLLLAILALLVTFIGH
jgi:hypothetical protein